MFRKISLISSHLAKPHRQGGQVSILFALLMPIFILFLGVALDLGWYYLNVSRLQNAADAAAVAGAQAIVDSENFSDYKNIALIGKYPAKVSNQYRANSVYELTTIENGKVVAEGYVGKNLSGNENTLVNSWTNNKVQTDASTLYTANDKLYFVVKLKDTIQHFFLPGWFDDMDAPVTAVAIMSKTAITADDKAGETSTPEMPASPFSSDTASNSDLPTMPSMPKDPRVISTAFQTALEDDRNKNVIVGNWEVQAKYINNKDMVVSASGEVLSKYESIYTRAIYSGAWNHFQDFYNRYISGSFYRTQTVIVLDDVLFNTDNDGKDTIYEYGKVSSVAATAASVNSDNPKVKALKTYNPGVKEKDKKVTDVGLPHTWKKLDSLNIDFRPEVKLSGKWLSQDWDLDWSAGGVTYSNSSDLEFWDKTGLLKEADIRELRIHTSINFDGVYKVRPEKPSPDILWVRIESEPMLNHPDAINGNTNYIVNIEALNSVNQIIINANASNEGTDYRPYVIFYDGPETNDVYETESNKKHIRDSLPVILNLNVPFRAILYAPNSPVVVIGDNKDYFQGFVVAKEYVRLKDDRDFFPSTEKGRFSLPVYYALDDTEHKNPCYKITDENGIEMFVDEAHGDIQFAEFTTAPTRYGTYNTFGRTNLTTHNYEIEQHSMNNMLLSGK